MRLVVNGEEREVDPSTTVKQLLVSLGLGDTLVAVLAERSEVDLGEQAGVDALEGAQGLQAGATSVNVISS